MSFLAYLHPIIQSLTILLGFHVMSLGLKTRNMRHSHADQSSRRIEAGKHYRRGIYFLFLYSLGYLDGLTIHYFFNHKTPFLSSHAYFASISLGLLLLAGKFGKNLSSYGEHDKEDYELHSWSAMGGLFLSLANAVTGYSLLP